MTSLDGVGSRIIASVRREELLTREHGIFSEANNGN